MLFWGFKFQNYFFFVYMICNSVWVGQNVVTYDEEHVILFAAKSFG